MLTFPYLNFTLLNAKTPIWYKLIYALESSGVSTLPYIPVPLSSFTLKEDVLYRTGTVSETKLTQLVISSSLVETTSKLLHDAPSAGHPGRNKTLPMDRAEYYDTGKHIVQCLSCAETKETTVTAPIIEYPLPAGPFDVIGIHLLQLPRNHQGSSYVLVCVKHLSRFTVLAPLPNKSAMTVAQSLVSQLICPYTNPSVLLSDNGT